MPSVTLLQEADAKYRAAKAAQPAPDESHRLGHGAEKDKVRRQRWRRR